MTHFNPADGDTVLDLLPDPVLVMQASDYRLVRRNQAAKVVYGEAPESGVTCFALTHDRTSPCQGATHPCPLKDAVASGEAISVEHIHVDQGGCSRYFLVQAAPMRDEQGVIRWIAESHTDITDQKADLELLSHAFHTGQAALIADWRGRIQRVNPAMSELTGFREAELAGSPLHALQGAGTLPQSPRAIWREVSRHGHWQGELQAPRKDGEVRTWWVSLTKVDPGPRGTPHLVLLLSDITYRRRLEAELARRATRDQLTGVYNRHHFELVLEQEMERSGRYGSPFALVMLDIDHFKAVNDWYGHPTGDEVLIELTRLVQESLRKSDILARWGGEEFMVLLPETPREGAETVAEQLHARVAQAPFPGTGGITISAGIAEYRAGETQKVLTKRADEALYRAKELGRNRLVVAP